MSANVSQKSNRINVKGVVYALLLSDTKEGVQYSEVKPLSPAMQVQLTPSVSSGVLYGNGSQQENLSMLNGIAMALDVNKIKIEDRAAILGNEYKNGILIEKAGDQAPHIAIGYVVEGTNKCEELVWLLKGRAQPLNDSVQQRTDNINFSTDTININFVSRDHDNAFRYYADTANADITKEQASKWFLTGPSAPPVGATV